MNSNECNELVTKILQGKIGTFLQYEEITDTMLTCNIDELPDCIIKREHLAAEIDVLDQQLCALYLKSGEEKLEQAVFNKINWGECPDQFKDVFLVGQKLISVISRILRKEEQVFSHVETQKEILLELIKKQNTGVTANASKYYSISKHTEKNITIFDNKC